MTSPDPITWLEAFAGHVRDRDLAAGRQLFAPGATSAYVVLLDMMAVARRNPVAPRMPNRGLVMWTFGSHKFDEVERRGRAAAADSALCSNLRVGVAEGARALTIHSPAGLMIEIREQP